MHAAVTQSEPPIGKQSEQLEYDYEDNLSTFGASSDDEDDEGTPPSSTLEGLSFPGWTVIASTVAASALAAG